jgi:hypothetical protein
VDWEGAGTGDALISAFYLGYVGQYPSPARSKTCNEGVEWLEKSGISMGSPEVFRTVTITILIITTHLPSISVPFLFPSSIRKVGE